MFGAILAVFIAGLMVGRTPEYLGKKIESYEMKMAMLAVLAMGASILVFSAIASVAPPGLAGPLERRPARLQRDPLCVLEPDRQQRLSLRRPERQYPLLQPGGGLRDAHRPFRGDHSGPRDRRVDGRQAAGRTVARDIPDHGPIWVALLIGVIVIVGALTFFPALSLGPIVEQLKMAAGQVF